METHGSHLLMAQGMRHANDVANATPRKGEDQSPLERFSGVKITPKLCHYHAFSCPTYILDNALYKVAKVHRSGNNAQDWAYTLGHRRVTLGRLLWFSVHAPAMSHPNFMSNSTIFLDSAGQIHRYGHARAGLEIPQWLCGQEGSPRTHGQKNSQRFARSKARANHAGPAVIHDSKFRHASRSARRTSNPGRKWDYG